jgi:hypothetical protein
MEWHHFLLWCACILFVYLPLQAEAMIIRMCACLACAYMSKHSYHLHRSSLLMLCVFGGSPAFLWLAGWRGVVCNSNGRVWSLRLAAVRLAGTLPPSISEC